MAKYCAATFSKANYLCNKNPDDIQTTQQILIQNQHTVFLICNCDPN